LGQGVTGKYFGLKGEEKPNDSPENEEIVWEYCKKITEGYYGSRQQ
jgi:hypothetical protein